MSEGTAAAERDADLMNKIDAYEHVAIIDTPRCYNSTDVSFYDRSYFLCSVLLLIPSFVK